MTQYDDELHGALFKNDRKVGDQDPDYRGECQIRGESFWLSGWINTSKAGRTYMRLSLRPKQTDADDRAGRVPTL
jgi:hypothetical protein